MLKRFCICLGLLLISSSSSHVFGSKTVKSQASDSATDKELVQSILIEKCGFSSPWQKKLFVKDGESIRKMTIHDNYLFVETSLNYLYCVDRNKGKIMFSFPVAMENLPLEGPTFYGNEMLYMVGNKLHVVDMNAGRVTKIKDYSITGMGAVYPPVRNEKFIYVADSIARLTAVNAEETSVVFPVSSDKDSLINSVIADDKYLVFSTKAGEVVRIKTNKPEKIWQFEVEKIQAPMVRDGKWIYVSSLDRKLYKLSIEDGYSGWIAPFIAGEELTKSVRIGEDVLYQYAGKKGMFAIDKKSGDEVWQLREGYDLLCEKGSNAYILAKPSRLVVMDNRKGKKLYSVNFASVTDYAVNTTDSVIYVAGENGSVMAIDVD